MLFLNIPLLWQILELTVQDWKREVTPRQAAIDSSVSENDKLLHTSAAFLDLQPFYLKSLFSYAVFFIALEGAYNRFYEEINAINRKSFLRVAHSKKPKPTIFVEKVRMIRNVSIAHIGSKTNRPANTAAAMMWQPMTLDKAISESWDLDRITFGGMKLTLRDIEGKVIDQSDDLEIKGISEMDRLCRQYLDDCDCVCAEYLKAIYSKLPITDGNEQYFEFSK